MKKTLFTAFCAVVAAALVALPASAEEWKLDPNHSKLKFAIDAKLISAEGIFRTFTIKDDINEQALEKSSFDMTSTVISNDDFSSACSLMSSFIVKVRKIPSALINLASIANFSLLWLGSSFHSSAEAGNATNAAATTAQNAVKSVFFIS